MKNYRLALQSSAVHLPPSIIDEERRGKREKGNPYPMGINVRISVGDTRKAIAYELPPPLRGDPLLEGVQEFGCVGCAFGFDFAFKPLI